MNQSLESTTGRILVIDDDAELLTVGLAWFCKKVADPAHALVKD